MRAPIVDTRNAEGAQGESLWLVGKGIVGCLSGRRRQNLDNTL